MAGGLLEESWPVDDCPALGVLGTEHQTTDASVTDGTGAHGAGLKCDHQG